MALNDYELSQIVGGKAGLAILTIVGGIITFIIGVVDGYLRPAKCKK